MRHSCVGVMEDKRLEECGGRPSFALHLKRCMDET